jgi:hypothetical protein
VFGDLQRPNSLHAFGYANGNPLTGVDPEGTQSNNSFFAPSGPKGVFDLSSGPEMGKRCREQMQIAAANAAEAGEEASKSYGWFVGALVEDAKSLWAKFGAIPCAPFLVPETVKGILEIGPRAAAADAKMQTAPALSPAWWIALGEKSQATVDAVSVAYGVKSLTAGPPMSTPTPVLAGVEGGTGALALPGEIAGLGSPRALTPFVFLNENSQNRNGGDAAGAGRAGKTTRTVARGKENVESFESLNEARADAQRFANLGEDAVPFVQEIGPQKGRVTGMQSRDGLRGWRLDFKRGEGVHVNWWDKTQGTTRAEWVYGMNKVPAMTYDAYLALLQHFPSL